MYLFSALVFSVQAGLQLCHWIAKPVFDSKTVWTVCAHKPCRSSLRLQQSEPLKVIVAEETVAQSSSDAFSPFVQRHQSDCWLGTETFSSLNFHSLRLFSARSSRLGMPLVLNTQIYFLRKRHSSLQFRGRCNNMVGLLMTDTGMLHVGVWVAGPWDCALERRGTEDAFLYADEEEVLLNFRHTMNIWTLLTRASMECKNQWSTVIFLH